MNVPHASHMGGMWERQIRKVRSVLTGLLQSHGSQLDDESPRTLMIEVEAIVNSRPLTTDDLADLSSLDVLTPNHVLPMKSSVILAPPGNFQRADVYLKKRCARYSNLRMNSGSVGERATWSHFRPDRNGPYLRRTSKEILLS